jgi:hypothetical protein
MARRTATPTTQAPARASQSPKAAPVAFDIPADFEELTKALKSAKGVLWTMGARIKAGHHYPQDVLDRQEAKISALQAAYDDRKPARSNGKVYGPSWVVAVDPATGRTTSKGADGEAVRALAAELRAGGKVVSVVPKA